MSLPTEVASSPLTIATTGHVGLNVTDLSRSIRFYRDVFGFEVLAESDKPERRYAFLGRDGNLVLTRWQQSAAARLADLGVPLIYDEILPHMPGMSSGGIFFADPDGTRVEVCTASGLDARPALEHGEPSCGFF